MQRRAIVGELGAEAARPQRDRARHRRLHVRVAGQARSSPAPRRRARSAATTPSVPLGERRRSHRADRAATRRGPDRCASGPRCTRPPASPMRSVSRRSSALCTSSSASSIDHSPAACAAASASRPAQIAWQSAAREQLLLLEHARVRDRRARVVLDEPLVEAVILAGREAQDALVERQPFVPEARHGVSSPVPRAAAPSCR